MEVCGVVNTLGHKSSISTVYHGDSIENEHCAVKSCFSSQRRSVVCPLLQHSAIYRLRLVIKI
jgi:hypothetical protein